MPGVGADTVFALTQPFLSDTCEALMGIAVNVCAPMGAAPSDVARMGAAHVNVLLYPETGESAARFCEKTFGQPYTKVVAIGVGATRDFLHEVAGITGLSPKVDESRLRLLRWSASVDSTYPDRQARVHLWRCHPRHGRRPHCRDRERVRGGRLRLL